MATLAPDDPRVTQFANAIRQGDLDTLQRLLDSDDALGDSRLPAADANRSLLHVATDWPGHFPRVGDTIALLISAGAKVDATLAGDATETPLHWAASSNDVDAVSALLDGGAQLAPQGGVLAGGPPLENAIGFGNWDAAKCLVERGAETKLGDEAALGMMDRIAQRFAQSDKLPTQESIDYSFWNACFSGQQEAAEFLLGHGANLNWMPDWDKSTPLDVARNYKHADLAKWLESQGAAPATKGK